MAVEQSCENVACDIAKASAKPSLVAPAVNCGAALR